MVQAVARCRRHEQKKNVHIYHVLSQHTIDVDIIEHRHKLTEGMKTSTSTIKFPKSTSTNKERCKLVENNAGQMALVPVSWLADQAKRKLLGFEEKPASFTSLINFSETFAQEDE